MPQLQLVGFDRVKIAYKSSVTHYFTITREQMAVWDDQKGFVIKPGMLFYSIACADGRMTS
jgi:hypothetical protein